jgi:hypothetical protein
VRLDVPVATFTDVPPLNGAWPSIEAVAMARVMSGCAPARFCPDLKLLRAELAVSLVRARRGGSYLPPAPVGVFSDVPRTHWAAAFIEQLYRDGITSGCGPQRFCPDALVSRADIAVFLVRARRGSTYVPPAPSGVFADVPLTHWAARYIEQIYRDGATDGCGTSPRLYCPGVSVTRADAAAFLTRAFRLPVP